MSKEEKVKTVILFNNNTGLRTMPQKEYFELICKDPTKPWSISNDNLPDTITLMRCMDDPNNTPRFCDIFKPSCAYREMNKLYGVQVMNKLLIEKFYEIFPDLPPAYVGLHVDTVINRLMSHRNDDFLYNIGLYTNSEKFFSDNKDKQWIPFIHLQISCWGFYLRNLPIECTPEGTQIQEHIAEHLKERMIEQINIFSNHKLFSCSCKNPPKWYLDRQKEYEKTIYNYAQNTSGEPLDLQQRIELQETINKLQNVKVAKEDKNSS